MQQRLLFKDATPPVAFKAQLLKWIGNKQRFAAEIVSFFPLRFERYFEPFLGSGAVLATLAPKAALGSDSFAPLVEIWQTLKQSPETLKRWYTERWRTFKVGDRLEQYDRLRMAYNTNPNGADLLFLCRSCYGGVVRFRKADGYMSTPIGIHDPIAPEAFARRVDEWHRRIAGAQFMLLDYEEAMESARTGDMVYCDPPYHHSQTILYGAQGFSLEQLFEVIDRCKRRGVYVALSIDGTKRSGKHVCPLPIPAGLFEREVFVSCGRSMLKRFQMNGQSLETEAVSDRLLLTY
ncbi:MAG: Dam family site-specific DNA-(adenine-N6)-methyltransferase [Phycisphaerae bacterium]|jgi:DNA adenine methylase